MADTYTTNLNLTKPEPGAAEDTWGISLNADLDSLDAIFSSSGTQINLNPNQVNFAQNKKAIFGTNSDLQIYHDGSNANIVDTGTGYLALRGTDLRLQDSSGWNFVICTDLGQGGEVKLFHTNLERLKTTATGINVTGTVVADGLTVEAATPVLEIDSTTAANLATLQFTTGGTVDSKITHQATTGTMTIDSGRSSSWGGEIDFVTDTDKRLRIASNGDISFYDDTGTSQNLKWDASADTLNFVDNAKATFGASNDLQIYHDGFNSYISDTGTGDLLLSGANIRINNPSTFENHLYAAVNGAVTLYYDNAEKLATTNAGIDVTGTTTTDGLTVNSGNTSSNISIRNGSNSSFLNIYSDLNGVAVLDVDASNVGGAPRFQVDVGSVQALRITEGGDISFYDDTGSTQGLFWDASAERLGLGTTSPSEKLTVVGETTSGSGTYGTKLTYSNGNQSGIIDTFGNHNLEFRANNDRAMNIAANGDISFYEDTGTTAKLFWDASAESLGIGTTSIRSNYSLDVRNAGNNGVNIQAGDATADIALSVGSTSTADKFVITSGGSVGIGTTSPGAALEVNSGGGIHLTDNTAGRTLIIKPSLTGSIHEFTSDNTAAGYAFSNSSSELMRVNSTGLGIGTSSPSTPLHVVGTITADTHFTSSDTNTTLSTSGSGGTVRLRPNGLSSTTGQVTVVSSGNVGIGTDSPEEKMQLLSSGNTLIRVTSGTSSIAGIDFGDTADTDVGRIRYLNSSNALQFSTQATERARIDSVGNLLIGKTAADIGTIGHQLLSDVSGDYAAHTSNGTRALLLNRLNSDGTIAEFRKDGTIVGSIGTTSGEITIGSNNTGIRFTDAADRIDPWNPASNLARDNAIDLGTSARRFKDLYLSGHLKTGGGGSNNTGEIEFVADSTRARIVGGYQGGGGGYLKFHTDTTGGSDLERMRIDSSGNLLVGATSYAGNSSSVTGSGLSDGYMWSSRSANAAAIFNRLSTDGEIALFRKNGSTVGSIGALSGHLTVGNDDTGLIFNKTVDSIYPWNVSTNSSRDAAVDLGYSGVRFKDLHLSGTANFGSLSDGTITITGFVDQDNMSSDSPTLLPTQQSVKAYVDANSFTINNNADNRIITGTATAGTLNAETTLTYGTTGADLAITGGSIGGLPPILRLEDVGSSGKLAELNHITGTTTLTSRNATSNGVIKFAGHNGTSETEYGRFDASGRLLVGTTNIIPGVSNTDAGVSLSASLGVFASRANEAPINLSRNSSDGDIALFRKDGLTVGSIGTDASRFKVKSNSVALYLENESNKKLVWGNVSGVPYFYPHSDNDTNIGYPTQRFKDLHLSGSVTTGDGTAASPAIKVGDNDTGLFQPTDNVLAFSAWGTERMRIDPYGKVGIGTTNPIAKLDVLNSTANAPVATFTGTYTGNGDVALSEWQRSGGAVKANFVYVDSTTDMEFGTTTSHGLGIKTGNTRRLTITSAGNATFTGAITTAKNDNTLTVQSTNAGQASVDIKNTEGHFRLITDAGTLKVYDETDSSERFRIDTSGNVGINNSSPSSQYFNNLVVGDNSAGDKGITIRANSANKGVLAFSDTDSADANRYTGYIAYQHTDNSMRFHTNGGGERMRIKADGHVGIGTTSPDAPLTVHNSSDPEIRFGYSSTQDHKIAWDSSKVFIHADPENANGSSAIGFAVDGTERARIDSSGNLLVGKTLAGATNTAGHELKANGIAVHTTDNTTTMYLNRKTSDGSLIELRKDNSVGGIIGIQEPQDNAEELYIANGTGTSSVGLAFWDYINTARIAPCSGAGAYRDNAIDLGYSGARFDDIYATNGTIQTSDENEKQDIQALTDAEQRVATACKGLIRRFRWQDSVAEKDDNPDSDETARYHFGVIAQDLQDAFTAEGLDASDYGMFISSTWEDDDGVEQTRLGVRYNELLAFIITTL